MQQLRKADAFYYLAWALLPFAFNVLLAGSIAFDTDIEQLSTTLAPVVYGAFAFNLLVVGFLAVLQKRTAAIGFLTGSILPWLWLSYFLL